ncbi:MAG: hypothetical protein Q8M03_16705 [Legionella sp.]|nr:hypothetical protein [Legionella sp.]
MLYRLFINYLRLRLIRLILNRVMGRKVVKGKGMKTMSTSTYLIELLATYFLDFKRKTK